MIRCCALALLLLVWMPVQAAAQASVRGGEHRNFTRVVVEVPAGATWTATQTGQQVEITLEGFDGGFDTRRTFAIIPRSRLSQVSATANQLMLDLACACRVTAFDVAGGYVALDILSEGARPSATLLPITPAPERSARVTPAEPRPNLDIPFPRRGSPAPALTPRPRPSVPVPDLLLAERQASLPDPEPAPEVVDPPEYTPPSALNRDPLDPDAQRLLIEIQNRLSQEFATAATRGVLDARGPSALPDPTRPQIDTGVFEDRLPAPEDTANTPELSNIRISSSMDLPDAPGLLQDRVSIKGVVCPPPDTFDLTSWADDRPFDAQISPLRRQLYGEFDKLDQWVATQLARTYLYFGFGAEARRVLMLDPALAEREHMLMALAQIMEDGQASPNAPLSQLVDCMSDTSLWAMMANSALPTDRPIDPSAALLALNKLPVHLRRFLAPGLSERLLAHGDTNAAATALRSLERLPEEMPPDAMLAQAKVSLKDGETETGAAQLTKVIEASADPSPEALIVLINERMENDQPVDAMTAGLVEAYAKELRDTNLGPELRRAHVVALLKSGQFDRAFAAAEDLGGKENSEKAEALRLTMLRSLTDAAEDVVFLDLVFQHPDSDIAALPRRDRLALIERLLNLGFAQSAQEFVVTLPERPPHPPSRLLAARIALALNQPERAQRSLEGIEGGAAEMLRADAKRQIGAHAQAHDLFVRNDRSWEAAQSAWLADDWQSLTPPDAPVFGPVAALIQTEPQPVETGEGMLARSSAILGESGAARETLLQFLNAPELTLTPSEVTQ